MVGTLNTAHISALDACTTTITLIITLSLLAQVVYLGSVTVYSFVEVKIIVEQDILQRCIGLVIDIDEQLREFTKRYALSEDRSWIWASVIGVRDRRRRRAAVCTISLEKATPVHHDLSRPHILSSLLRVRRRAFILYLGYPQYSNENEIF